MYRKLSSVNLLCNLNVPSDHIPVDYNILFGISTGTRSSLISSMKHKFLNFSASISFRYKERVFYLGLHLCRPFIPFCLG